MQEMVGCREAKWGYAAFKLHILKATARNDFSGTAFVMTAHPPCEAVFVYAATSHHRTSFIFCLVVLQKIISLLC